MKEIFPYEVLFGDVECSVARVTIDSEDLPRSAIDAIRREVELTGLERAEWSTAQVDVEVTGPASELRERSDNGERPVAVAVVHCGPSNTRTSVVLQADAHDPARWYGQLELERLHWFGQIGINCVLASTVAGIGHRVIGAANVWRLFLDDLPPSPVRGSIRIAWEDFAAPSEELAFLRRYSTDPWFLLLEDPDLPALYLNRSFEGLEALLADQRRRPASERALNNHARGSISTDAWIAMFNASLESVEQVEDGALDWPSYEWQRTVLEALLARMYPERGPDDALQEVWNLRTEPGGAAAVQQQLLPAAGSQVGAPRLLRDGIRLLGGDSD